MSLLCTATVESIENVSIWDVLLSHTAFNQVGTFICDLQSMRVRAGIAQCLQVGPETLLENTFQINCLSDVAVI